MDTLKKKYIGLGMVFILVENNILNLNTTGREMKRKRDIKRQIIGFFSAQKASERGERAKREGRERGGGERD